MSIYIHRKWSMPNHETFSMKPIAELIDRYIGMACDGWGDCVCVDPFARNYPQNPKPFVTYYTNDLNPNTSADSHKEAVEFLHALAEDDVEAQLVLYDPPYSPRQIKEMYNSIGRNPSKEDTQISFYSKVKDAIVPIVEIEGYVICCGWNTNGMGKSRGFELVEILIVPHGSAHNDTLVTVERKIEYVN